MLTLQKVRWLSNDIKRYVSVWYSENQYSQICDIPNFIKNSDNLEKSVKNGKITEKTAELYEDWSETIEEFDSLNKTYFKKHKLKMEEVFYDIEDMKKD